jgi:hypothetical protein
MVTIGGAPADVFASYGTQMILVDARPAPPGWADVTVAPVADPSDSARLANALQYVDPYGSGGSGSGGIGGSGSGGSTITTVPWTDPIDTTTTTSWWGFDPGVTTTTPWWGPEPGDTTSTTWSWESPTTAPAPVGPSTTAPAEPTTTRVGYDSGQPMGWNVAPTAAFAPIGAEGAAITVDQWNEAYEPDGANTGVRLG